MWGKVHESERSGRGRGVKGGALDHATTGNVISCVVQVVGERHGGTPAGCVVVVWVELFGTL